MVGQRRKKIKFVTKDFFTLLVEIASTYKKYALLLPIAVGSIYFFKIWMNAPFWFFVEQQIFKQNEKINQDFADLKYYDIVVYNAFCEYDEFKLYMKVEPINNRLKIDRTCKLLNKYYNALEINVKVRS